VERFLTWVSGALAAVFLLAACSGGVASPVAEGDRRSGGSDAEVFALWSSKGTAPTSPRQNPRPDTQ